MDSMVFLQFAYDADTSNIGPKWNSWIERLDNFFEATGVTAQKRKRALLLHYAGPQVFEIYKTLKDENDDYVDTRDKLDKYFTPRRNIFYEKYQFRMAKQQQNEKTDQFVTRLRTLAQFCTFTDIEHEIILQILLTTNSTALRKQILSKPEETRLEKILELARTLELVESQTNTIENKTEINAIKTASTSQSCQFCGSEHPIKKCPAYGKRCNKCNGLNH
jgi:hypothetical protein